MKITDLPSPYRELAEMRHDEILMFYALKRLQEHPTTTDIYIISSDSKDYDDAVPAPRTVEASSSSNANKTTPYAK